MGSKIKVVVNFIYGYQNLSEEKYETNEKKRAQLGLLGKRKIQKNTRNYSFSTIAFSAQLKSEAEKLPD